MLLLQHSSKGRQWVEGEGPAYCCPLAVLRIRNKSFGSCVGSGSGLKLVSDSDPDSNPDPNSDSNLDQKLAKLLFFVLKYLPSLIFKHRLPSLSSMTWLRTSCAINLQDSDSDPLVRGTDPRIRIRTKKSRIHNTVYNYL